MAEDQAQQGSRVQVDGQSGTAAVPQKKKASWLRTILWMISMMLLVNAVMAVFAYFLFFHKK